MLTFLCHGDWGRGSVTTQWVVNTRRREPDVEAAIDFAWAAAAARLGAKLFDGPMCRLEAWEVAASQLRLTISPSSYKPFLGTNMTHPRFAALHGREVMANPVGVSPILLTADGYLLLGRRNESVAYYPGRIHPFAGCLEPKDADAPAGVFAAVYRELREELNLLDSELADPRCVAMVMDSHLLQCELIFFLAATLTREQIEARLDPEEHHAVYAVAAEASAVEAALASTNAFTPVGVATLLLWGRRTLGVEWFMRHSVRYAPAAAV